jgi:hypothetical protein
MTFTPAVSREGNNVTTLLDEFRRATGRKTSEAERIEKEIAEVRERERVNAESEYWAIVRARDLNREELARFSAAPLNRTAEQIVSDRAAAVRVNRIEDELAEHDYPAEITAAETDYRVKDKAEQAADIVLLSKAYLDFPTAELDGMVREVLYPKTGGKRADLQYPEAEHAAAEEAKSRLETLRVKSENLKAGRDDLRRKYPALFRDGD